MYLCGLKHDKVSVIYSGILQSEIGETTSFFLFHFSFKRGPFIFGSKFTEIKLCNV